MAAPVLPLWPHGPPGKGFQPGETAADAPTIFLRNIETPTLHVFRPAKSNGVGVLVMPGGAYDVVSILNEGVDVARAMTARGYTIFVLAYRLPGEGWAHRADVPLQDAQRAMRLIRSSAATYGIAPSRIAALGFSAGGHLAATLVTDFGRKFGPAHDAIDRIDARPDAVGLIYPVIAMVPPFAHPLSSRRLLGDTPSPDAIALHSPAVRVTAATPPLFLVHAFDDTVVPPDNTMLMMSSMRRAGRPVEVHLYEEGGHGFGLAPSSLPAHAWLQSFDLWLRRIFSKPAGAASH